ncbi:hypothetical protein AB0N05_08050 [Nocardia sp. NPDC051030]|uniref:hypothetical protein n=1 Tax=Nocardia sp. NPDC051030 TaxID=3155162 RepID=UPI00341508FD
MKSTKFTGVAAVALTALGIPALLAPSASADTDKVRVDNVSDSQKCAVGKPCFVRVRLVGSNRLSQVTISVNNTVIGYAVPEQDQWDNNAATAEVTWVPSDYGNYTVTARQDTSSGSINYNLSNPNSTGSFSGMFPTGSAG